MLPFFVPKFGTSQNINSGRRTVYMKNPLIVKQYEDTNLLAHMFQSCNGMGEISNTFVEMNAWSLK